MRNKIINGCFLPFHFSEYNLIYQTEKYIRIRPELKVFYEVTYIEDNKERIKFLEFESLKELHKNNVINDVVTHMVVSLFECQKDINEINVMGKAVNNCDDYISDLMNKYLLMVKRLIEDVIHNEKKYDSFESLLAFGFKDDELTIEYLNEMNEYYQQSIDYIFKAINMNYDQILIIVRNFYTEVGLTINKFLSYISIGTSMFVITDNYDNDIGEMIILPTGTTYYFHNGFDFKNWIRGG